MSASAAASACPLTRLFLSGMEIAPAVMGTPLFDRFSVKLDAKANTATRSFHLLSYNVDNAMREEKIEATKWANRKHRVRDLIVKAKPHVVCLQELRNLPGNESVGEFVASLAHALGGYRFDIEDRNPEPRSFMHAILWDPTRFVALRKETRWLSDTPGVLSDSLTVPHDAKSPAYIVQCVMLAAVKDSKMAVDHRGMPCPFWVLNTHLGMDEQLKTESCKALLRIINDGGPAAYLLCGDFNFFPDKDAAKQRAILTDAGLIDLGAAYGMVTSQGKVPIEGTFIGYEHDDFKPADSKKPIGRLDNVFASDARVQVQAGTAMTVWTETMRVRDALVDHPEDERCPVESDEPEEELSDRNALPSDHLPISVDVSVIAF